jgi:hypothetical protein
VQNHPQNVVATSPRGDALIDLHAAGPAQGAPADVRKDVNLPFGAPVTPSGLPAAVADTNIGGAPTCVVSVFLGNSAYPIGGQARSGAMFSQCQDR